MKRRLHQLAVGELAAVAVFWVDFFLFEKRFFPEKFPISVVFSLGILSFILIQASVFWLILLRRMSRPGFAEKSARKIYKILKRLDVFLLCIGLFGIAVNHNRFSMTMLSFFLWLFALIEWVNYYKWRLSYSLNPAVLIRIILERKLGKSRIAKEIEKTA